MDKLKNNTALWANNAGQLDKHIIVTYKYSISFAELHGGEHSSN